MFPWISDLHVKPCELLHSTQLTFLEIPRLFRRGGVVHRHSLHVSVSLGFSILMFRFRKNVLETTILSICPCFLFSNYYSNKYFVGNRPLAYAVKATGLEDESKEYHELFDLFNVNYEVVLQIGPLAYYIVQEVYTWILQRGFTVKLNVKCPYFAFQHFLWNIHWLPCKFGKHCCRFLSIFSQLS